jgi:hypothetical protein
MNKEKESIDDLSTCSNFTQEMSKLIDDKEILKQLVGHPKQVMEYALSKMDPHLQLNFDSQIGLWEGFSLEEHTESVMLFFKENFVDKVECDETTQAIMNLIILCHDIGKVEHKAQESFQNFLPPEQKYALYNVNTLRFLKNLKIEDEKAKKLADFITDITQKAQVITTSYYVIKNKFALDTLDKFSKNLLEKYDFNDNQENVDGLSLMSRVLQTCDSGAYTLYGKTRNPRTNKYYSNLNEEWTKGFIYTQKGYRFKQDAQLENTFETDNREF